MALIDITSLTMGAPSPNLIPPGSQFDPNRPPWALPTGGNAGAKAALRALLGQFGLADLAGEVYNQYVEGITDPDLLMVALEGTRQFQARFPGIRDEEGMLLMRPSEYVVYERSVTAKFAQIGLPAPTRSQIGAIVQSRRSAAEVAEDVEAYDELRRNPYLRKQFYLFTGQDPGDVGLFALALGLAPDIERTYEDAVNAGIPDRMLRERANQVGLAPLRGTVGPGGEPLAELEEPPISEYAQPGLFRSERLRALRMAELTNRAQFQAGGESATTDVRPRTQAF